MADGINASPVVVFTFRWTYRRRTAMSSGLSVHQTLGETSIVWMPVRNEICVAFKKQPSMKYVAPLLSILLLAAPVVAQERVGRHALIIGVSQYQNPAAPTLRGVPYDVISAGKMADAIGVPRSNQIVLRDEKADKASIIRELDRLAKRVAPGDRVLVYFSGHGSRYPDARGNCVEGLYPYDGNAITHAEFAEHIAPIGKIADKLLTIVDACHSGGVVAGKTRSFGDAPFSAKFFSRAEPGSTQDCKKVTNFKARGLFDNVTRLGALQENTVEIAAALPDEQSWDDPTAGGLATLAIRDCLLGKARDLDASGGINLAEIQQCAQQQVNDKLAPHKDSGFLPHTITVLGNKNLIPVAIKPPEPVKPESPKPVPPPVQTVALVTSSPTVSPDPVKPIQVAEPPKPAPVAVRPPDVIQPPEPVRPSPEPPIPPPIASLATIKDVFAQRDPRFEVKAIPAQPKIAIGKEGLKLTVQTKRDGYLYVVLLGSDRKSFYLLYPNGYDSNNTIKANKPMTLPTPGWSVKAGGPAGKDELLVLVSESPRDLKALSVSEPTSAAPFTYALTDLGGRAALIDFLTGRGVQGRSESFGAAMFSVMEYEGTK